MDDLEVTMLEEEGLKLENTLICIKRIKEIWENNENSSEVPDYIEDLEDMENAAKYELERNYEKLNRHQNQIYNSKENRRAEYEDFQLDLARGK